MRFKNLSRFRTGGTTSKMDLAVPLPKTPDGRVYRYSPNEKALPRHFVIGDRVKGFVVTDGARKRMKLPPGSKQTVCPYSGVVAGDQDFTHPDDVKAAIKTVEHAARADVAAAIHGMFRDMARRIGPSRHLQIKTSPPPAAKPRPRFMRRDLLRELVCDHCGRDYGVFAIALFCPDCGAPNLRLHFAREAQIVAEQVKLADSQDGQEELAFRLMGNAHEDVLTAFEATLKSVYLHGLAKLPPGTPEPKPVKNDFQNVDNAKRRFAELGLDPFSTLTADELAALRLNIQKRHIIGHNLGVMDEKFAEHAVDARIGETVHLVGEDIRRFAALSQRVVDQLDTWLGDGLAAPVINTQLNQDALAATQAVPIVEEQKAMSNLNMSELPEKIGIWIASQSKDGRPSIVGYEALTAAFSGIEKMELADAIAELELEGYVQKHARLGHPIHHIWWLPRICSLPLIR